MSVNHGSERISLDGGIGQDMLNLGAGLLSSLRKVLNFDLINDLLSKLN